MSSFLDTPVPAAAEFLRSEILSALLNSSEDCIKILDLDGKLQFLSAGGMRVMEVDDFSILKGCFWPQLWTGAGHASAIAAVKSAREGKSAHFRGPADTAKGNPRYWDVSVNPVFDADGNVTHLLSISRDITDAWRAELELKEALEREKILAAELQHRIKNMLALVSAIAQQTMRQGTKEDNWTSFLTRLEALGSVHDILTEANWVGTNIVDVVTRAIAPHRPGDDRIRISGPALQLSAKQSLALALGVHELATNAVKYGALSTDQGMVDIAWSVSAEEPRVFTFRWQESGGPEISSVENRKKGFGSRLLERSVKSDFNGTVRIDYGRSGLRFELETPLENLPGEFGG